MAEYKLEVDDLKAAANQAEETKTAQMYGSVQVNSKSASMAN